MPDGLLSPTPRETLTLEELAAALNLSLTTAYELARKDALPIPALKLGRQWRFSRRALNRYLDGETVPTPPTADVA